jgi:antibiotic biosynthesis monooxygenase (ABM) superfamily enzyme
MRATQVTFEPWSSSSPMSEDEQRPSPPARPPRYKQAVITWLGVYPILTLTLALLRPVMATWPLPLQTLWSRCS